MAAQLWRVWVTHSAVKRDISYWSLGSNLCKEHTKWCAQQALKNQSSISVPESSGWLGSISSLVPICKPRDPQGQVRPHVLCQVPQQKPEQEPQAQTAAQDPLSTVTWFSEWCCLLGSALCWLASPSSAWYPRADALTTTLPHSYYLSGGSPFWQTALKIIPYFFFLVAKTDHSSDMLCLFWHETAFLFLFLGDA